MKGELNLFKSRNILFAWVLLLVIFLFIQAKAIPVLEDEVVPVRDERIYLQHADSLVFDQFLHPDAQRLSGNVVFHHKGMTLYCDSAVLYEKAQSFEAFGEVRMVQGDTLSLTGKYLYYDGNAQIAQVRYQVEMRHRNQVLLTDSLNYDRICGLGYFFEGGKLIDGENTLTSDWGEYYTATRKSTFNYSVKLKNPQFTLTSDTLHYDNVTKWSQVLGPSNIVNGRNRIYTTLGYYNSETERAKLYNRSIIFNEGTKMTGDSIFYDKLTGVMKAFSSIVYEDTRNKKILQGDFCQYNELSGTALAYDRALAKDYSNPDDTLFVHADTLRMYSYNMETDSVYRVMHGYFHVRAYRTDVQAVCDSLVANSKTRKMTMYRDPVLWSGNRQILGEEINVFANDSTIDSVYVERQALMVEQVDTLHFNQVAGQVMKSYFRQGEIYENRVDGNVYVVQYPMEKDSVLLYQNYTETSQLRMFMENRKLKKLWSPSAIGAFYPIGMAPPERTKLENFAWFDYMRPKDKYDIFEWRGKAKGTELKATIRRDAPLQRLKK